ncbi:hypothetical protein KCP75_15835 [Salmonella enterica subsp. enterica]|nr:hypothetical protein KCP75_15835 [Salmonella enterica subsp. enterica]
MVGMWRRFRRAADAIPPYREGRAVDTRHYTMVWLTRRAGQIARHLWDMRSEAGSNPDVFLVAQSGVLVTHGYVASKQMGKPPFRAAGRCGFNV